MEPTPMQRLPLTNSALRFCALAWLPTNFKLVLVYPTSARCSRGIKQQTDLTVDDARAPGEKPVPESQWLQGQTMGSDQWSEPQEKPMAIAHYKHSVGFYCKTDSCTSG